VGHNQIVERRLMRRKHKVMARDEEWRYRQNLKKDRYENPNVVITDRALPELEKQASEEMRQVYGQLGLPWGEG
jgi:hypothetical protein